MQKTLLKRGHVLASPDEQQSVLSGLGLRPFGDHLADRGLAPLRPTAPTTLQMNVGRRCNQVCAHCHVDAGPDREEMMTDEVVEACLALLATGSFRTLDITGGAPELHPRFGEIVRRATGMGVHVLHRCNLTAIRLPAYRHLPGLLAEHRVQIVASLPALQPRKTDRQRGDGVFDDSILSLRELNRLGYAQPGSGLVLDLVTNPVGAFLPAGQASLEREFKARLLDEFGIRFDRLLAITNMPISRYLEWLELSGNLRDYMDRLVAAFNPDTVPGLMCRTQVSVGPDGRVFDCDFNQMLDLDARAPSILDAPSSSWIESWRDRAIRTAEHCYGCTAGAGSSCQGAVS